MRFWSACRPAALSSTLALHNRQLLYIRRCRCLGVSATPQPMVHLSFGEIVDRYDAFILDQFGVLHNGLHALDGAIEAVEYLYGQKKKLIILSNTSAPSSNAISKLAKLGFNSEWFVGAVTSGEEASRYVRNVYGNNDSVTKVLFLTWDATVSDNPRLTASPQAFLDQCGNVEVTDSVADASVVILHGSEVWYRGEAAPQESLGSFIDHGGLEIIDPLLTQFRAFDLPMVCANPDRVVVTPTGGTAYMPGLIAQRFIDMGGNCRSFGKPDVQHFEACLETLGLSSGSARQKVAHVGDSLHHDVAGASAAGIPSIFVSSGIHANQLQVAFGEMPMTYQLDQLFLDEGSIYPTHIVPTFQL
jgi:HAD superfamily hydrolase (TIGR01459 family)